MKRRTLTLTLCILACVALIGVGFASWIITNDVAATADGTVEVDTVDDQTHKITVTTTDAKVVFGPKTEAQGSNWLRYNSTGGKAEKLTVEIEFTVTNPGSLAETPFEFKLVEADAEKCYEAAVTANYVAALPTTGNGIAYEVLDAEAGKYKVTITFAWGSAFGGNNPSVYYNAHTANEKIAETEVTYAEDASTKLNSEAFTNLAKATFKLTITPKTK